jgi:hypothetical protein
MADKNVYIPMWVKTDTGLVDYAFNRGLLSLCKKKNTPCCAEDTIEENIKNLTLNDKLFHHTAKHLEKDDDDKQKSKEKICREKEKEEEKEKEKEERKEKNKPIYFESSPKNKRSKKERIPATVRNIVWVTHFQTSKKGNCWLCKVEDISSANFECGHVVSEKNGGKPTIDNLRPICSFCNKSVGTMNMEDFKRKYNIP